jgi:hypothetical protein
MSPAMALSMSIATIVLPGACRSSVEQRRATAQAEEPASKTTVTSVTIEEASTRGGAVSSVTFRTEQAEYRRKLRAEIDRLDRLVSAARPSKGRAATTALDLEARRDALVGDLAWLDRITQQDGATLRPKLDRDLAVWPDAVTPRSDRPGGP